MPTPSQKEPLKRYAPYQGGMDESELGDYCLASDVDAELARLRECEKALQWALDELDSVSGVGYSQRLSDTQMMLIEKITAARRALGGRATE